MNSKHRVWGRAAKAACMCACLASHIHPAQGADWPQFRGPNHDGTSSERINKSWSGTVTNPVWQLPLGSGLGSLAASGGLVFTQVRRPIEGADKEVCVALNSTNGVELWATVVDEAKYPNGGVGYDDGPRTTPAVDAGSVYVLSSYLKLYRLEAVDGSVVWQTNLVTGYGATVIPWQNAASPIIENGLIFLNANAGTTRIMVLRTSDGSLAWRSRNEAMTHSTPVLSTIDGVRQLIFATQTGLVSLNPETGGLLWRTNYPFSYSISLAASPVVYSNIVFITGYNSMGAAAYRIVQTNATLVPQLLWRDSSLQSVWSTPICHHGFLYGQFTPSSADADLRCIDVRTGALRWEVGGFGRGSAVLVDNHLVVLTEMGELVLVKPEPTTYTELGRCLAIPDYDPDYNKCWNSPAVAEGKVYVRSTARGAMFDLSAAALKLDLPVFSSSNVVNLSARTVDGTAVGPARLPGMALKASTNAGMPLGLWATLTNQPFLSDGAVSITNVDASGGRQFFLLSEPE